MSSGTKCRPDEEGEVEEKNCVWNRRGRLTVSDPSMENQFLQENNSFSVINVVTL